MALVTRGRAGGIAGALEALHQLRELGLGRAGLLDRHRNGDSRKCARRANIVAERPTVAACSIRARAVEAEALAYVHAVSVRETPSATSARAGALEAVACALGDGVGVGEALVAISVACGAAVDLGGGSLSY